MTRIAYFNGKFVPETEVVIPFRDRSFNRGDGCFDMTRTFDGRIFRLEEHVERLYRSLRYLRIDIGLEPKEVVAISEEVVQRNEPLRAAAGDWWLAQRVSLWHRLLRQSASESGGYVTTRGATDRRASARGALVLPCMKPAGRVKSPRDSSL